MKGGQKGGEFYTPKSVVELMVEILEPYEGRIFDPFSGSGGMFVQSQKFIEEHGGDTDKISIYGQEIKESTLQISKMNLYLRGLDANIKQGDSILNDQHKGLEADYILTNPPFNMEEWGRYAVADDDPRFVHGMPPEGNGNFAFIQHMLHHTAKGGLVGTVMANGSLSSDEESDIRKSIVEADLLDAVIALPNRLFYTTEIPVALLILSKGKGEYNENHRTRKGETLFVDAREYYKEVGRTSKTLTSEHISKIATTVRAYRGEESVPQYSDERGYCKVVDREELQDHDYVITPGRFVGIPESIGEVEHVEERVETLSEELREEFRRSDELQEQIEITLREVEP
jgi:type I restriction enzyme M protein